MKRQQIEPEDGKFQEKTKELRQQKKNTMEGLVGAQEKIKRGRPRKRTASENGPKPAGQIQIHDFLIAQARRNLAELQRPLQEERETGS